MDEKKVSQIHVQELRVPSQSSLSTQRPIVGRHESSAPQDLWPAQPQILKETKLSKWINYAYDTALCIAPVILMVKIVLVIWSSLPENSNSSWTSILTEFNNQVRTYRARSHATANADVYSLGRCIQSFL